MWSTERSSTSGPQVQTTLLFTRVRAGSRAGAPAADLDVAKLLISGGALVDSADGHGNTPLFKAVFESRGRGEMIQLLLRQGADRNRVNKHGVSPRTLAATIANFDVKKWLE